MRLHPIGEDLDTFYGTVHVPVDGLLQNDGGRIVGVARVTEDATLTAAHHNVFVDTDDAAITISLPAGVAGTKYRIVNTGNSDNDVTLVPDGSELLFGENASERIADSEALIIVYESTEGWW